MDARIAFADNRLLPLLYGVHDKNLAMLEKQLGVVLINRGNQLIIEGPEQAVEYAKTALHKMYKLLESGEDILSDNMVATMRMLNSFEDQAIQDMPSIRIRKKTIMARSHQQAKYIKAIQNHDLVFGLGPAGTGKTYLAVCSAISCLISGHVDRIILSRPAVEAGERLGFLPGDMKEKVDPYLRPIYDVLYEYLPADLVDRKLENGEIEIAPLAFMRGRSLKNAFVVLDEAQNTTAVQMKMFLTRLGQNSHFVVNGDLSQIDLPHGVRSGLYEAVETLESLPEIGVTRFGEKDVVRHPLVARIVKAYADNQADAQDANAGKAE